MLNKYMQTPKFLDRNVFRQQEYMSFYIIQTNFFATS